MYCIGKVKSVQQKYILGSETFQLGLAREISARTHHYGHMKEKSTWSTDFDFSDKTWQFINLDICLTLFDKQRF
jgi:hypothetical protein